VLPAKLRPLRKLVLAACSVQFLPAGEILCLELSLLRIILRELGWEGCVDAPELQQRWVVSLSNVQRLCCAVRHIPRS
jgi:hypothetical protein